MFFDFDWIPQLSYSSGCVIPSNRSICKMWILWKKWKQNDRLLYLPPAGDGSGEYELQRLASVIRNPSKGKLDHRRLLENNVEKIQIFKSTEKKDDYFGAMLKFFKKQIELLETRR